MTPQLSYILWLLNARLNKTDATSEAAFDTFCKYARMRKAAEWFLFEYLRN